MADLHQFGRITAIKRLAKFCDRLFDSAGVLRHRAAGSLKARRGAKYDTMLSQSARAKLMESLIQKGSHSPLSEEEIGLVLALLEDRLGDRGGDSSSPEPAKADALEHRIAALEGQNSHLRETINALYSSTSWKMSAPLRKTKESIRRLKTPRPRATLTDSQPPNTGPALNTALAPAAGGALHVGAGPEYKAFTPANLSDLPASLYAFYLPQFHPIKENDEWWGKGFTEWTNVRPAEPLYAGHYQPHEPDPAADLGYYDLRDTTQVMSRQIALARNYGVEGFCFYFYWFAGHRLLETPLLNLLADPDLDVPFCLCWANENWSRRWDGNDNDVLMAQDHSPEDDLAFIAYVSKYLKDPRYRTIDGKPVLLVYRPIELPDAKATAKRWRDWCRKNGIGEIYLAYTQSFENNDPRDYGFDGAVEFPPNNSAPPDLTDDITPLSEDFSGKIYDWDIFPQRSDKLSSPDYPLFRSVCPAWDNTARRKQGGTVFKNSRPDRYRHWLSNVLADTKARIKNPQERLVFINAWNEWAEGAHLEPDARYGHAYLHATRDALIENGAIGASANSISKQILLISHDGLHHGAQILVLNLARTLKQDFGYRIHIAVLGEGPLVEEYAKTATVHSLAGLDPSGPEAKALASKLFQSGVRCVIANTTVSGMLSRVLKEAGFHVTSLVHELPSVISKFGLEDHTKAIAQSSDVVVFPAEKVQNAFKHISGPINGRDVLCPQGAYKVNRYRSLPEIKGAKALLRRELGLSPHARIAIGVGYKDHRKGFDLFLSVAEQVAAQIEKGGPDIVCVWAGHDEPSPDPSYARRAAPLIAAGRLVLPGRVEDTDLLYAGADAYLLTSREDPYPSTVLEALDVGLPVIGFQDATGSGALITAHSGRLIAPFDAKAMGQELTRTLITSGEAARNSVMTEFRARPDVSFRGYVHDLLALSGMTPSRVSAIIPNFNYAHFLPERFRSVAQQSYPLREIIILDDCSADDSPAVIKSLAARSHIPTRVILGESNSGSVFAQWLKGAEAAQGEFIWIAEADDLCHHDFLKVAMAGFTGPDIVMSYTQSKQMAEDGHILDENYLTYVSGIDARKWQNDYTASGAAEIAQGFSVKNSVPNVSGVVFRREALVRALRAHMDHIRSFRVAGDWAAYVHILEQGGIAYNARALNYHRRHSQSVTISKFTEAEYDEIQRMQTFVQSRTEVPAHLKVAAQDYLAELRAQFGLTPKNSTAADTPQTNGGTKEPAS
jgi:glycosyltransferase involved in cell wall biosynthesis